MKIYGYKQFQLARISKSWKKRLVNFNGMKMIIYQNSMRIRKLSRTRYTGAKLMNEERNLEEVNRFEFTAANIRATGKTTCHKVAVD